MNAAAIEYIWKAIQESERSDELQFMDDKMLIMTAATRLTPQPPDQSDHRDRSHNVSQQNVSMNYSRS